MKNYNDTLKKKMECPEFRAEYEALEPEFASLQAQIDERTGKKRRMGEDLVEALQEAMDDAAGKIELRTTRYHGK